MKACFNIKLSLLDAAMSNSVILMYEFDSENGFRGVKRSGLFYARIYC